MDTFFRPKIAVIFGRDPMRLRYRGLETNIARFMSVQRWAHVQGARRQWRGRNGPESGAKLVQIADCAGIRQTSAGRQAALV